MLMSKLVDRNCSVLISIIVIYHTLFWFLTADTVEKRLLLSVIVFVELVLAFVVSQPHHLRQDESQQYRPHASHSFMLIFLVPLCALKDSTTGTVKSDLHGEQDILWLSIGHVSIIMSKYATLHGSGRYTFLTYGLVAMITICLGTYVSSSIYVIFFVLSAGFLWKSIDAIPLTIPKSFSFGEIAIVLQLFCDWISRIFHCVYNIQNQFIFNEYVRIKWTGTTIVATVLMATLILSVSRAHRSLFCVVFIYVLHAGFSVAFLTWMFQENFFTWLLGLSQDCVKVTLLISWLLLCAVTVVWTVSQALVFSSVKRSSEMKRFPSTHNLQTVPHDYQIHDNFTSSETVRDQRGSTSNVATKSSMSSYKTRKVFHLFILLVYVPGLLLDSDFLFLSSCAALGAFIIFEAFRVFQVPFIGKAIDDSLRPFTDERDQGPLFLTHIYLLIGLSLPLWITWWPLKELASSLRLYSGVLSLGIGDSIACMAGIAYGRHRWPGTKKTMEGSFAAVIAQLLFIYILVALDLLQVHSFFSVLTGLTVTFLIEAFTDQIDNLVLPIVLFPFFC